MNFKQIAVAIALLAVAAVVFGFWASNTPAPQAAQQTQHILAGTPTEAGPYKYAESTDYYTIEATYPARVPLNGEGASQRAQLTLEQGLKDRIDEFKANVSEMLTPAEQARLKEAGRTYAFSMEYKDFGSPKYVSYLYTVYVDTGGAHPNGYFKTFVFDDATGAQVQLADLFKSEINWLEELSLVVSNGVVAEMKKRSGQDDVTGIIFAEGVSPKVENFENFYIDNDTFVVAIPPYQVAAYAMGSFEVRIPMSDLAGNLR